MDTERTEWEAEEPEENVVRVFSLRRALAHEKKQYEQYIKQLFGHGT